MRSRTRIIFASLIALATALLLLVTLVLPAEYGFDPLGTGERLGLIGMAEANTRPLLQHGERWRSDRISFPLAPFEAVEYKFRMHAGDTLLFTWEADNEVLYDMHAEPQGAAPGYAETFDKGRAQNATGSYTAPFTGIHGWFWQNRHSEPVAVTLTVQGFVDGAVEMRDGRTFEYELKSTPQDQP